ncbi:MAG: NADH-quinone oxidoreductase subunit L [Desulfobulbaceae bacterium]|nr:NADH-quinone oxidoreductase subunit L [Desulfobulbaceae bacterium]
MKTALITLLIAPLLGALYQIVFGNRSPRRLAEVVSCAVILVSFVMATVAFFLPGQQETIVLGHWITVDTFSATMDIHCDSLAAIMALMVTFVSLLITIYSVSYMSHDHDYARYFAYLNLFVFFMLVIVLADNLLFLFLGWEGVGFCSYALIGFRYEALANARAGRKAFLLTRIGDIGLGIAISLFFVTCHTLSITAINAQATSLSAGAAMTLGFLLLWSATGKSAQLPLLVWLPDAMAGPTPVSALIHAATMVTAGVYLLIRLFPVISQAPEVLLAIASVGTATALFAACAAMVQRDIKRVLAYSTISQVGYMFLAIGVGDIIGSMFHLLTHAFFKSLLFLSAGAVIHALHDERDITKMGESVRRHLPAVFIVFLAGSLALGGVPPAAGFFSKGRILLATLQHGGMAYKAIWVCATFTALLTTLYTFRLFFMVFTGKPAVPRKSGIRAVPQLMEWVLWPLALFALFAGFLNLPHLQAGGGWLAGYLAGTPGAVADLHATPSLEWAVENGDSLLALGGLILAYFLYGPKNILGWRTLDASARKATTWLFSGFGLDRLYEIFWVTPYEKISQFLWHTVDETFLDQGLLRVTNLFPLLANTLQGFSSGILSTSIKMLLFGFAAFLIFLAV